MVSNFECLGEGWQPLPFYEISFLQNRLIPRPCNISFEVHVVSSRGGDIYMIEIRYVVTLNILGCLYVGFTILVVCTVSSVYDNRF